MCLSANKWHYSDTLSDINTIMKTEVVTTLKRQATTILADLRSTKEPVLITEHGKPSAYLLDVSDYEEMQKRMLILEGIAKGESNISEGKLVGHHEAENRLSKWLK